MQKGDNLLLALLLMVCTGIGILIYAKRTKARKEAQIKKIREIIAQGIGISGDDIKKLIHGVIRANNFDPTPYANKIEDAPGLFNDDEQAVYDALSGKSRAQIASIYDAFMDKTGTDLDMFLDGGNWGGFMNAAEYEQVINIVKNSK